MEDSTWPETPLGALEGDLRAAGVAVGGHIGGRGRGGVRVEDSLQERGLVSAEGSEGAGGSLHERRLVLGVGLEGAEGFLRERRSVMGAGAAGERSSASVGDSLARRGSDSAAHKPGNSLKRTEICALQPDPQRTPMTKFCTK